MNDAILNTKTNLTISPANCDYITSKIAASLDVLTDEVNNHPSKVENEIDSVNETLQEIVNSLYYLHCYANTDWFGVSEKSDNNGSVILEGLIERIRAIKDAIDRNADPNRVIKAFNDSIQNYIGNNKDHTITFADDGKYTFDE